MSESIRNLRLEKLRLAETLNRHCECYIERMKLFNAVKGNPQMRLNMVEKHIDQIDGFIDKLAVPMAEIFEDYADTICKIQKLEKGDK